MSDSDSDAAPSSTVMLEAIIADLPCVPSDFLQNLKSDFQDDSTIASLAQTPANRLVAKFNITKNLATAFREKCQLAHTGSASASPFVTVATLPNESFMDAVRRSLPSSGFSFEANLGQGNFSEVLHCVNVKMQRHVALKVLTRQSDKAARQFFEEGRLLAKCKHPNIVAIFSAQEIKVPGQRELVKVLEVELCLGGTLRQRLDQQQHRAPSHSECMQCFTQLLDALSYLQSDDVHVLHGDIKPENVLVSIDQDGVLTFKLADFGLSKDETFCLTTTVMGTP
jgi:hypothetical protein